MHAKRCGNTVINKWAKALIFGYSMKGADEGAKSLVRPFLSMREMRKR